jgi:hypothetical protein
VTHLVSGPTPCAQLGSARRLAWPWRDRQACLQRPACFFGCLPRLRFTAKESRS